LAFLGNKYIDARKLIRGATESMYVTTDLEYFLHSEDVRIASMKHSRVEVRKSSRSIASSTKEIHLFDEEEMQTLKIRCWKGQQSI
jgi:hypothetical protein